MKRIFGYFMAYYQQLNMMLIYFLCSQKFKQKVTTEIVTLARKKSEKMEECAYPMCQHLLEYIKEFDTEWINEDSKKKSHIENVHKQISV